MATRYKVVGKTAPRKPKRPDEVRTVTPIEAIWLAEDIQTLEDIGRLVARLHDRNFVPAGTTDWDAGVIESQKTLRRLKFIVGNLQYIAEEKLRREYLAGVKLPPRPQARTLGDLCIELLDDLRQRKGRKI